MAPTKEPAMLRATFLFAILVPVLAFAQPPRDQHAPGNMHDHIGGIAHVGGGGRAVQPGQAAFGAIQEIVEILEADPATDWSKVDIDALRQHLIDMDNVTLHAEAKAEPVAGGMRFVVSGSGPVRDAIRRMVDAHARIMNGADNWRFVASNTATGADLTVTVPAKDAEKLRGLGFIGVLAHGMHHQAHHLMIARGIDPHH
jgi:hypothetical protein